MKYSHIKPGDRVRVTLEGVAPISPNWLLARGGAWVTRDTPDSAVVKVEKLKPPKPKAGDVITGERAMDTQWKRGTMIRNTDPNADQQSVSSLVLGPDGRWHLVNELDRRKTLSADTLNPGSNFRVLYVAE